MSEKRFIIVKSIENYYALVDKKREDKEQILIFSLHKEQLGVVCDLLNEQQATIQSLKEENEELRKKLECCEYEHFKKELDKIHEKVEKGDLSDFGTLTISDKGLEHWNGVLK